MVLSLKFLLLFFGSSLSFICVCGFHLPTGSFLFFVLVRIGKTPFLNTPLNMQKKINTNSLHNHLTRENSSVLT